MWDMDLEIYKNSVYANACEHGFYKIERSDEQQLMEVICEICEMVQANRNKLLANVFSFEASDKDSFDFEMWIKNTFQDELADIVIRLLSLAGHKKIDLGKTSHDKRFLFEIDWAYNMSKFTDPCEFAYEQIRILTRREYKLEERIHDVLMNVWKFSDAHSINLKYYVIQKMRYNEQRPYLHGKAF